MNHVAPRAAIVAELAPIVAPVPVCDDEPGLISQTSVVVAWVSSTPDAGGWIHQYEIRIILVELEASGIAQRDELTMAVVGWAHATGLSSRRSGATKGTATIAKTQYPAVLVTTNVIEPQA